jgi:hypothetical protein
MGCMQAKPAQAPEPALAPVGPPPPPPPLPSHVPIVTLDEGSVHGVSDGRDGTGTREAVTYEYIPSESVLHEASGAVRATAGPGNATAQRGVLVVRHQGAAAARLHTP